MLQNLILQAKWFQEELIVSDIEYSGKAYMRSFTLMDNATTVTKEQLAADEADLLADARRITLALGGKTLLVGYRADGFLAMPLPEAPPVGFVYYTGFINLTGSTRALCSLADMSEKPPCFRRTPLVADQARSLHPERWRTDLAEL